MIAAAETTTGQVGPDRGSVGRVDGLDGLRAVAAFVVFVHHVGFTTGDTFDWIGGGILARLDIGVPIFFALSGFLLFRPIVVSIVAGRALRPVSEHLWRRALRIYPAFWVALGLIVLLTSESFKSGGGALSTALLVHIHWPGHVIGPMPQAWSLATEVSFYLMLPLMARLLRPVLIGLAPEQRVRSLIGFCASLVVFSVLFRTFVFGLDNLYTRAAVLWLPANIDYFAIGMVLAVAVVGFRPGTTTRDRLDRWGRPALAWWLGAVGVFVFVCYGLGLERGLNVAPWPNEMLRQSGYGVVAAMLLFPLVFGTDRADTIRRFTAHRTMNWLGLVSYSFYLWHMVFVVHLPYTFPRLQTNGIALALAAGTATLAVSAVSFATVEKWGMRQQGLVHRPVKDPTPTESLVGQLVRWWSTRSLRMQLGLISGAGLLLRFAYVIVVKRDQTLQTVEIFPGDQFFYSLAGDALADGKGFVVPWNQTQPAADHGPLTAILAAPGGFLPGEPGTHLFEQRLIMCVVGAIAIFMIGMAARAFAGPRVAVVAATIAAVYPGFWINDGLVMAETMTTLAIAGLIMAVYRYRAAPSTWGAVAMGLWVGIATLSRAESLLLAVLIIVPAVLGRRMRAAPAAAAKEVAVAAVTVILLLAPWVGPNLVRFNEPVLLSTNDGITLLGANCDSVYRGGGTGFWTLNDCIDEIDITGLDQSEVSRVYREEGLSYIRAHLDELPRVVAIRVGRAFSLYRPLQMADWNTGEGREVWTSYLAMMGYYLTVPLAIWGAIVARRRSLAIWPMVMLTVHVLIIVAAFYGIVRFRVPAEVGLVLLAALAVHEMGSVGPCRRGLTSSSHSSSV